MEPKDEEPRPAATTAEATKACRRSKREEHEADYQESMVAIAKNLQDVEGPDMKETMKEQIQQWFFACR